MAGRYSTRIWPMKLVKLEYGYNCHIPMTMHTCGQVRVREFCLPGRMYAT